MVRFSHFELVDHVAKPLSWATQWIHVPCNPIIFHIRHPTPLHSMRCTALGKPVALCVLHDVLSLVHWVDDKARASGGGSNAGVALDARGLSVSSR